MVARLSTIAALPAFARLGPNNDKLRGNDMRKHWALLCLVIAAIFALAAAAQAADYPTRPIRLVVPYVAGGPTDAQARLFAQYLSRDLKQSVFVENKGGAQGAIGAEAVAHGDADGYSLLFTTSSVVKTAFARKP